MKMKKLAMIFAVVMMISTTAAAQETEAVTEAAQTELAAQEESTAALSDDWKDYQIQIGDQVIQFPMMYEDFLAYGWTPEDDPEGQELEPYQYDFYYFEKDGTEITVYILNLGKNVEPVTNCIVGGLAIDSYYWEDITTPVILPGGIERGVSDAAAIEAAYGTPSDVYEGDLYKELTYDTDYNESIELTVYNDSGVLEDISIRNFVEPEGFNQGTVSEEVPASITAYVKPEALSEDPTAYEISLDGQVYSLPVPVSVLIADGWELDEEDSDAEIYAAYFGWVTLRKGGQEIRTTAINNERYATIPQNCWVEELEVGGYTLEAEGELPGGIKTGMPHNEFLSILEANGLEYEVDSSDSYIYYTYNEKEYDQCMQVIVYIGEDEYFPKDTVSTVICSNTFE